MTLTLNPSANTEQMLSNDPWDGWIDAAGCIQVPSKEQIAEVLPVATQRSHLFIIPR